MKNKFMSFGQFLPLLIVFILFLSCPFINAQITGNSWAINEGTINWEDVTGIHTDNIGNYVIAGSFYDSIRLGNMTVYGAGSGDIYSATYNKYGNFLSARSFGSSGTEYPPLLITIALSANTLRAELYYGSSL
jgi:hypothetical protein